jgi:predicted XRE-type DNA-binding protein
MPRPRSTDVGIVEEALESLNPTESVTISQREILATIGRLETKGNNKFSRLLKNLLKKVYGEIENFDPENKRYGASHSQASEAILLSRVEQTAVEPAGVEWNPTPDYSLRCLPPAKTSINNESTPVTPSEKECESNLLKLRLRLARVRFDSYIWKIYGSDFIKAESAWGNPIWETSFEDGFTTETNKFIGWRWAAPSISEVMDECDHIIKSFKVDSLATPEERLESLKNQLLPDWVSPLLKVVCGDRKHGLRLDAHKLTITSPNRRHEQTAKGFQTTFYLDATAKVEHLARAINLKPRDISQELERLNSELAIAKQLLNFASQFDPESVEQRQKTVNEIETKIDSLRRTHAQQRILKVVGEEFSYSNQKITVVSGVGKCGHQRFSKGKNGKLNTDSEFAEGNRIIKLVEAIAKLNEGKKIAVFDHKAFTDSDSKTVNPVYLELEKQGLIQTTAAHFRDSRGINRLKDCQVLIKVGRAIANLGEMAAQWQAMTGQIVNPAELTGRYGEWVRDRIISEDIQEIARQRANRRPDEQLDAVLIGDYSEADIEAIANYFTGATIERVDAYDICPESARKGVQTERGIVEAVWAAVQSGLKITTSQVAEIVGVSRSRVSQVSQTLMGGGFRRLVEVLEMLFLAINSKTNTLDELDLTEDELWAAREFLPAVVGDLLNGDTTPEEVAEDAIAIAQHYGSRTFERILAVTPLQTLVKLFGSILPLLPLDDLNAIE